VYKAQLQPLRKKLNKCRDPDRWNLVELQKTRREQSFSKADSEDGDPEARQNDDGSVFGPGPDNKRRKVKQAVLDDPFGGPL